MEKARNVDIRQFYREDLGVHSEELLDKLEAVSQAVTLQKGEILNKKGERQTMLPFLIEGMMRCVTLDREGEEKTRGLYHEPRRCGAFQHGPDRLPYQHGPGNGSINPDFAAH